MTYQKNKRGLFFFLVLSWCFCSFVSVEAQRNQTFTDTDEIYRFTVPAGVFTKIDDANYYASSLGASIHLEFKSSYLGDDHILNFDEEKQKIKRSLNVTYFKNQEYGFTVSGYDRSGQIVYVKATCESLSTRSNPDDEDELVWKWNKMSIVTFTYPPKSKKAMDPIIGQFLKSYKIDLSLF
jgi:hypothetical protein